MTTSRKKGPAITVPKRAEALVTNLRDEHDGRIGLIETNAQNISKWLEDIKQSAQCAIDGHVLPHARKKQKVSHGSTDASSAATSKANNNKNADLALIAPVKGSDPIQPKLDIDSMKVRDLQKELRRRGLPIKGLKAELKERLATAIADEERAESLEISNIHDTRCEHEIENERNQVEKDLQTKSGHMSEHLIGPATSSKISHAEPIVQVRNDDAMEIDATSPLKESTAEQVSKDNAPIEREAMDIDSPERKASDKEVQLEKSNEKNHNIQSLPSKDEVLTGQQYENDMNGSNQNLSFQKSNNGLECDKPEPKSLSRQEAHSPKKKPKTPLRKLVKATSKLLSPKGKNYGKNYNRNGFAVTEKKVDEKGPATVTTVISTKEVECNNGKALLSGQSDENKCHTQLSVGQSVAFEEMQQEKQSKEVSGRELNAVLEEGNAQPNGSTATEYIEDQNVEYMGTQTLVVENSGRFVSDQEINAVSGSVSNVKTKALNKVAATSGTKIKAPPARKLSTESVASTASTSTRSTRHEEIRSRVREEQALKAKQAAAAAGPCKTVATTGNSAMNAQHKTKIAEMREKMREQAKAKKVLQATTNSTSSGFKPAAVGGAGKLHTSVKDTKTAATSAAPGSNDVKKKNIQAIMREKAAAEASKLAVVTSKPAVTLAPVGPEHYQEKNKSEPLPPTSPMDTYDISEREEDSSCSEESDSENEDAKPKKRIPDWAQRPNLQKALEKQCNLYSNGGDRTHSRIDPDTIFGNVFTCDLSAIFGDSKRYNKPRKETGDWRRDQVTHIEKQKYKEAMGYA